MFLTTFTLVHVVISLLGIFSGFIVVFGLLTDKRLDGWTALFLGTTVATSVTGFFFPVEHFMPSHAIGILSLLVLAVAIYARYARHLAGKWRKSYVITAVVAFYFNVFVGIVQAFAKIPALKDLAPTQSEAPFKVTQAVVLGIFIALAALSALRFHDRSVSAPPTT
jgi:succinate dehydrogenase/fumarate reductase cytochrome b subunit